MNHYSNLPQTMSNTTCELTMGYIPPDADIRAQLDQALATIERLQTEKAVAQFALDQSNAARDDMTERYQESLHVIEERDNTITWHQHQSEGLRSRTEYLMHDLEWMTDINNNPDFEPAKKTVLQLLYPFAKKGAWFRVPVVSMSKKAGMKYYGTFSNHLREMGEAGLVEVEGNTWFTGEYNKKGDPIFKKDLTIKFSEELLRFPGEVHIEKEDKRKGNGKGGGKNAKPKTCPGCGAVTVNELDAYQCRGCNHRWEEGKPKDANRDAKIVPWDYGQQTEEDATELREAFAAETSDAAQDNDETTRDKDITHTPGTTLFPEDTPPAAAAPPADYEGPFPPPDRACFKCNGCNWKWDESVENYLCANDHVAMGVV